MTDHDGSCWRNGGVSITKTLKQRQNRSKAIINIFKEITFTEFHKIGYILIIINIF